MSLICRTCMSEAGDMSCLFNTEDFGDVAARICDVLRYCTSIQVVEGDSFPQQICSSCITELNRVYAFRKLCEKTDVALRTVKHHYEIDNVKIDDSCQLDAEESTDTLQHESHFTERSTDAESENCTSLETEEETSLHDLKAEYKCENCNLIWRNLMSYQTHIATEHGISLDCKGCNRSFSTKTSLDHHRCRKRLKPVSVPSAPPGATSKPRRDFRKPAKPHHCPTCNKSFRFPVELVNHLLTHSDEKPYECSECRQCFASPAHLKTHSYTHSIEPMGVLKEASM